MPSRKEPLADEGLSKAVAEVRRLLEEREKGYRKRRLKYTLGFADGVCVSFPAKICP